MIGRKGIVDALWPWRYVGATSGAAVLLMFGGYKIYTWNEARLEQIRKHDFLYTTNDQIKKELREAQIKFEMDELGHKKKAKEKSQCEDVSLSGGKFNSAKQFQPTRERRVSISVVVPRQHVQKFVGKVGANIHKLQRDTQTTITSQKEKLENGDRVFIINGHAEDARLAEFEIHKFLRSQPMTRTISLDVPTQAVGRIIGRNGERIRAIQDTSGARVTIDSKDDPDLPYGQAPTLTRTVSIRGTDSQIEIACGLIRTQIEAEETLRNKITSATTGRTNRRGGKLPVRSAAAEVQAANSYYLRRDGSLEVFVSCVYNPNNFCIQVVGTNSVDLDKLCETMTTYYNTHPPTANETAETVKVGDVVVASFDLDRKMYRGKVLEMSETDAKIMYVDFGDRRVVPLSQIRPIRPEHLKLRYQAIEVTLNLDYQEEEWPPEIINDFCKLAHCADWTILTANIQDYLKEENEDRDVLWIELFDNHQMNIGDEILNRLGIGSKNLLRVEELTGLVTDCGAPEESQPVFKNGATHPCGNGQTVSNIDSKNSSTEISDDTAPEHIDA